MFESDSMQHFLFSDFDYSFNAASFDEDDDGSFANDDSLSDFEDDEFYADDDFDFDDDTIPLDDELDDE